MNKLKPVLLLTLFLAMFTHCGVFKDNTTANSEIDTTKIVVTETNIADAHTGETIITSNDTENVTVTGETLGENVKNGENGKDTIDNILVINDPTFDWATMKGVPITAQLPEIFTDLFPEAEWELFYFNNRNGKSYITTINGQRYGCDRINDFISLFYQKDEITDKERVEFYIYLFFHPYDNNMKIISTTYYEDKIKLYYNYEIICNYENEQLICYILVRDNEICAFKSFKEGREYKSDFSF